MEMTKPKMRLKLSYPTQNSARKLISASLKKKKASTPLKSQETRQLIGKTHIHYHFGVPWKKQNWESFSLNFHIDESQLTNDFVYKIGIKQSDSCTFCGEATENLVHLFWSCKYSKAFWKDCYQWMMQNTSKVEKCNPSGAFLFGLIKDAKDLLPHHLLHIARHYIYTCKQRYAPKCPNVRTNSSTLCGNRKANCKRP